MTIDLGAYPPGKVAITIAITSAAALLSACGTKEAPLSAENQNKAISRLELRIEQLERQLGDQAPPLLGESGKVPAGPVSSITMRTGTADDRLRIYWADGTCSDLPCTKEQNTWACG